MKSVRFWGKIMGIDENYYVIETEPAEPLPPMHDPVVEKSILSEEEIKNILSGKPTKTAAPQNTNMQQEETGLEEGMSDCIYDTCLFYYSYLLLSCFIRIIYLY